MRRAERSTAAAGIGGKKCDAPCWQPRLRGDLRDGAGRACRGAQASRVSTDLGGRRLADERAEGAQRQDPRTDIGPAHRQAPARAIQRDQADRQVKERDGRSRPRAVIQGLGAARPILYEWRRRGQELRDPGGNTDEASSLSNSHRDFVCIPRHSSGRWNRRGG